jgi:hypothetical protein
MHERLTRTITPPPQSEQEALARMGCDFEERQDEMVVTYPVGAIRETIDAREGRYAVSFTFQYEQRQVTELYNHFTGRFIIILKPLHFC